MIHKQKLLLLMAASLLGPGNMGRANEICAGVTFMPTNLVLTRAQDQPGLPNETDSDETKGLVDAHTYNHFYTFQVDRDVNERNEGLVMDLISEHDKASTSEGFAFRLRAEFNSAEASRTGMGFRVVLGAKVYDDSGYTVETLAEMTSLNSEEGEGTVAIDIPSLPAGRSYQLRYEFGQKEVLRSSESLSMEEDTTATGDSLVTCNLPFFTQELVLIDRKALKNRVRKYNQSASGEELDILKHPICDFSLLDGEEQHAELGLQCNQHAFTYPLGGESALHSQIHHGVDELGFATRTLAEYPFHVSGTDGEPITQLFKMTVGLDFAVGAGFSAILRRVDGGVLSDYEELHPFACLLDQSCQFAWRQQKNHQSFQVVLTTGEYVLQLLDHSQEAYTTWLVDDLQLSQVPFTVYLESYPILQNEVREHCPFMFLLEDFIQQKYIDGQSGQKFHFADKVIMNLYELKAQVLIVPELDSHLKVVIREAFGVNAIIQLCHGSPSGTLDCFHSGEKIGTTAILYSEELQQDQEYTIVLDYSHSILAFHKFEECPHLPVEISMISTSEAQMIKKNREAAPLGQTDKQSRANLKDMFHRMEAATKITLDDPEGEGQFTLVSRTESNFEVLASYDWVVNLKQGLFAEIFYSPYDDEVLQLYVAERYELIHGGHKTQADLDEEYDNDDKENQRVFSLNQYKSGKTIWVDLEPGEYTMQILMLRQPSKDGASTGYYEKVNFQLYMRYDAVNLPREVFLPGHLNYHGMFGVGDETHDFGHVTLFWDDLTLWHKSIATQFKVESEMGSLAIQLEQADDLVKIHLTTWDHEEEKWKLEGEHYPEVTDQGRIDTVEVFGLVPNQLYKIELFKDAYTEHSQLEDVEMGERYGVSFSLKIDLSEFDDSHIAANLQKTFREFLPVSMEQVAKEKRSNLGHHEKSFTMGNRNMIHLIEYGDGWQDEVIIPSYVPKEKRVFTAKQTEETIVASLPFEVTGVAEVIYAGIYEFTQGANLMSLHIIEDETHEEVALSRQGKHLSLIQYAYLTEGTYYLVVKNDRVAGLGTARQAPLEFILDVVRHQIPEAHEFMDSQLEAMQLCQLPQLPLQGFNRPGYLHPINGNIMQSMLKIGIQELDSGSQTHFTLTEDSLVTVYVEAAEDIPVALQIQEQGGVRKALALSTDQDRTQSNFLKQEGFKERNVVQLREFLAKGSYIINAKAVNEDVLLNFDQRESFCDTFTMAVTIHPLKLASMSFSPDTEEEFCEDMDPLVNQLQTSGMVRGNLVKELTKYGAEVGYFDFDGRDDEGPFMIYFQLDYDVAQEGVVAVVLSQYDKDYSTFTEVGLYTVSDSQTTILQIVERGTYAISIQSIVSTSAKFQQLGFGKHKILKTPLISSHCFRGVYTYMVASVNDHDGSMSQFVGFNDRSSRENRVRVMESIDDMRDLHAFMTCHHSELPQHFPISDEGFEHQYAFRMSSATKQVIDLIIEEPSLVRVVINIRNPSNAVHALLLSPGAIDEDKHAVAKTDAVHNSFLVHIDPHQEPYLLKLVHTEIDTSDPCPLYDFHIAVKPLPVVAAENLSCVGNPPPEEHIEVTEPRFKSDIAGAFTDEMVVTYGALDEHNIMSYDIHIDLAHSDYLLDVELKNDFLTGDMHLTMFTLDTEANRWEKIAQSAWFDEHAYEDISLDSDAAMSTKRGDKTMVQKLRYVEDVPQEILANASSLMLRVHVHTFPVVQALRDYQLYDPASESLCFNFDLSIFAEEANKNEDDNTLIRVDWQGKEQSSGKFDASGRVTAFLEFEKSLAHHVPAIKSTYAESIYLQPLTAQGALDPHGHHVPPSHFKLKFQSDDTLLLGFAPYTLEKGTCYALKFAPSRGVSLAAMLKPEIEAGLDLHVCVSGCECDELGTEECLEDDEGHVCVCHPHFQGDDCSECAEGYYRNADGFCEKGSVCADLGGEEDCHGFGTCYQEGEAAVCDCDPGFTHDGLNQCARCADPLMHWPHECHKERNWLLEQQDYECDELQRAMPRQMYKSNSKRGGADAHAQVIYQQQNGVLEWAGRYALIQSDFAKQLANKFFNHDNTEATDRNFRKSSLHKFFVAQTSTFRLHLSTLDSHVLARWAILDHEQELVSSDSDYLGSTVAFGMLTPLGHPDEAMANPYTLRLEYEHERHKAEPGEPECPKIEVHFVVEPAHFHVEALECQDEDLESAKQQELSLKYKLTEDLVLETPVILPSTWLTEAEDHHKESLFTLSEGWGEHMATIAIDLTVERQGIFSALVGSHFSAMNAYISLKDRGTNQLVAIDKPTMLDDVESSGDHLLGGGADAEDVAFAEDHSTWDHLSVVEVPHLAPGHYTLEIGIPKAHWFIQKGLATCLSFDFMMEYVARDAGDDALGEFTDDSSGPVDVLMIFPPSRSDLHLGSELNMVAHLGRAVDFREAASQVGDLRSLCRLVNGANKATTIEPAKFHYLKDKVQLMFDFESASGVIEQAFTDGKKKESASCWHLRCKGQPAFDGDLYFKLAGENQKYCFEGLGTDGARAKPECNPFAQARQRKDGSCACTPPYKGKLCEECDSGFFVDKQETRQHGAHGIVEHHTVCVPEEGSDYLECNGFGTYNKRSQVCDCEEGYAGEFCEMCENAEFEYPDCTGELEAGYMESEAYDGFNARRREQVYHEVYHLENEGSPFQQQCQYTDFPNHLNQIQNHKEFVTGDFHIADIFTVNHDADNVIEFTPRMKGLFKIMLKQPELEIATEADEAMHLEIGVVKADGTGAMTAETNHHMRFHKHSGSGTLIDFTVLEFPITKELVDEPMHLYFRSLNQTHDPGYMEPQLCAQVFMELEFRATQSLKKCDSAQPELVTQKKPIVLGPVQQHPEQEQISTLQIAESGEEEPFFYHQDFYVENNDDVAMFDIEVQLAQKFIDQHLILPVVEILELGIEQEDFDASAHKASVAPECHTECFVAGHKLFNAFTIMTTVPRGTMLRVWLYQNASLNPVKLLGKREAETCVNYALNVRTVRPVSSEHEEALKENLYCEHTRYAPRSLNRRRYLGDDSATTQQDFSYIENFRVDNLKAKGRETSFTLKERTVVRIDGTEHDELQFFITILKGKHVVAGQDGALIQDTESMLIPSIFTVLEAGDYVIHIGFLAREAEILRQPCQSIQLQMAMRRADKEILYPRSRAREAEVSAISLETISSLDEHFFEARILPVSDDNGKFQTLYDEVVIFEDRDDMNLAMKVSSDFLRADVNFVLIHVDSEHHLLPQHTFEDAKKLVVPDLAPGYYRIIVFMQNVDMARNTVFEPAIFSFNFRFFSFEEKSTTFVHPVALDHAGELTLGEPLTLKMPFSTPEKLECYAHGRRLPATLTHDVLRHETDFAFTFAVYGEDLAFVNEQAIVYHPDQGEDVLRLLVDEGVRVKLYHEEEFEEDPDSQPIAISHNRLGNNVGELVARNLDSKKGYVIRLLYAEDPDDFEEKSTMECLMATLQVKIASSDSEYRCLSDTGLQGMQSKIDSQTLPAILDYSKISDRGKHLLMVAATKKDRSGKLSPPKYEIEIKQDDSDLEVSIESSDHLYGSILQIVSEEHDDEGTSSDYGRGMKTFLSKVLGDKHAIQPAHITVIKHMTKLRYMGLSAGKYIVRLAQPAKPAGCDNVVDVLFQVNQSLEKRVQEKFASGRSMQVRYQSKIEVNKNGVFKLPTAMPVHIDGYRFLGGGKDEENHVLFSDTYSLNDDESLNVFKMGKLESNGTYVRVYVEDSTIGLNLTCIDPETKAQTKQQQQPNGFLETEIPSGNDCSIGLYHQTKKDLHERIYLGEKVRITFMAANIEYVKKKYLDFHKEGLTSCPTNQWPLALAKDTEVNTNSDEQSYYNYPLVRFPLGQHIYAGFPIEMNNYYFRFNETQRFYFEVGSNFVENHAVLKLAPAQKSFGSFDILGKQLGNINVIDQDVPPGDYKLTILAIKNADVQCGLFSLRGMLNMHSAMAQHLPGSAHLVKASTICEIRNSAEAPAQIYANQEKTRKGNEAVIDPDGNFFRYYPDLLIVKHHNEVLEPWTHEILVELQDTSFLQVTMGSEYAEDMSIKVYNKFSGLRVMPALRTLSDTSSLVQERKAVWKLEGQQAYMIELEYAGDMYNRMGEEDPCAYFDLVIAINSIRAMASKLSCDAQPVIAEAPSLLDVLPQEINAEDLKFKLDGLYKLRFPQDFKQIEYKKNGIKSKALMLPTKINLQDNYSLSASMAFDVHVADFILQLIQYEEESAEASEDGVPNHELLELSSNLINLANNDDETFQRKLNSIHVNPSEEDVMNNIKYMMTIEEKQASLIFNEVARQEGVQNLCLPFIFKLRINKGKDFGQGSLSNTIAQSMTSKNSYGYKVMHEPSIIDFKFRLVGQDAHPDRIVVPYNVARMSASVLLTEEPTDGSHFRQKAFKLVFNVDGRAILKFKPQNVEVRQIEVRKVTMYEVQLDYRIDLSQTRSNLIGASDLNLQLQIDPSKIKSLKSAEKFTISEKGQRLLQDRIIIVEPPEDLVAKTEVQKKHIGQDIKNTLSKAINQMQKMKNEGQHVDKDLEESIEQIQDYDYENMEPEQVYKLATSFENISKLMTQQNEQHEVDHDAVQESPKQRVKSMKAQFIEAAKQHGGVKCACVHGVCDEGDSECSRCDQGWRGHMCDIPIDFKKKDSRLSSAKIEDDDEDELIGHGKMGNANQQYEHNEGRRWGKKQESSNEYAPRKAYGNIGKSTSLKDSEEGEAIQPTHKSNNHHVSSKDLDDDDDDYYGHGGGGGYGGGGGGSSYGQSSREVTHAQTTSAPLANQEQGFFGWIFWSFIWLVKWFIYAIIAVVCLMLIKTGCESVQERLSAAQAKKRKGRRKRASENEDGMGFVEKGDNSSEEGEDNEGSPIELAVVNRKQKDGLKKGKRNRDSEDVEPSSEEKQLHLFDQQNDQESGKSRPAGQGQSDDYNPFDDQDASQKQGLMDTEVIGDAMVNELDDALDNDSSDEEKDEFGAFV